MNIYDFVPIPKNEIQFLMPVKNFLKITNGILPDSILNFSVPVYKVVESTFEKTSETISVFDSTIFKNALMREFFNRLIIFTNIENNHDITAADLVVKFENFIVDYKKRKSDLWGRIIGARAADFSPIANYDKYSDGYTKYEGEENFKNEQKGQEKNTTTENGKEIDTHTNGERKREQVTANTPYNDTNFFDANKISETDNPYIDSTTRDFENRKTEGLKEFVNRIDENKKSFTNRQDTNKLHEYGNIGVQTTISILREYLEFYKNDITAEILLDFIDEISIY